MKYRRILLKLSGESLMGEKSYGFDPERMLSFAGEIREVAVLGVQIGIVIGGGNIFRGLKGSCSGVDRREGDYMGMLATVINAIAMQSLLNDLGVKTRHLSGLPVEPLCEKISGSKAIAYLEEGYVVFLSGGTGNPYFTTDSAAALRALEIKADVILKGTRVDGIFSADPEKDPHATKFDTLDLRDAYDKNLQVMDLTAYTLCLENQMPILVFNMNERGNLLRLIKGETLGTLVTDQKKK